jgi:enoyl-CoA hydratase/carnithine racemase
MSLRIEQDRRLCRIALAAPEKRNIFDAALASAFLQELREASEDPNTGAILIEADGPVFCGGFDPVSPPPDELFTYGRGATKPIIAAVKGGAVSAGLAVIANAHVAIAAQGLTFGLTDIRNARWHDGVFQAVAAAIGQRRALELGLTGRIFSTPEALSLGLIHSVAPAFELDDRATEIATALANANPDAIRAALSMRTA